jgi:hypothetical protein
MPCPATHSWTDEAYLGRLEARLRGAQALTPELLSDLTAACARFAGPHEPARAGIAQLIRSGAWTDAALALVELELPRWRLRRLVHDGGEWRCAFSRQRALPTGLDEIAEASHETMSLAILIAFIAALRQTAAEREPWPQAAPPVAPADGHPVCCDNFA